MYHLILVKMVVPPFNGGSTMSRSLTIPKPRATQLRTIRRLLEGPLQPRQRRRAEAILLYAAGLDAQAIARLLQVHGNTILHRSPRLRAAGRRRGAAATDRWCPRADHGRSSGRHLPPGRNSSLQGRV